MAKNRIVCIAAAGVSLFSSTCDAAVLVQKIHASGYVVAGTLEAWWGEYFTNRADLGGKSVSFDISTDYAGGEIWDNIVTVSYNISNMNVYTYYSSLPNADGSGNSNGNYYCGCDSWYDHATSSGMSYSGYASADNGTFVWGEQPGIMDIVMRGPVTGSTAYGPIVPVLVGDFKAYAVGEPAGGVVSFSFVLTDVKATLVDLSAVPEPSSWAMMICGFAVIGGAARRRRARLSLSCA